MKFTLLICLMQVALVLSSDCSFAQTTTGNGYVLSNNKIVNFGSTTSSNNYKQSGTSVAYEANSSISSLYLLDNRLTLMNSPSIHFGDLNGDGAVTTADALRTLQIAVGLIQATPSDWTKADVAPLVNGKPTADGRITASDALVVLERSVGTLTW